MNARTTDTAILSALLIVAAAVVLGLKIFVKWNP
jgi:hypothetical protein